MDQNSERTPVESLLSFAEGHLNRIDTLVDLLSLGDKNYNGHVRAIRYNAKRADIFLTALNVINEDGAVKSESEVARIQELNKRFLNLPVSVDLEA